MTKRDIINYLNSKNIPYAIGYDIKYKKQIFINKKYIEEDIEYKKEYA